MSYVLPIALPEVLVKERGVVPGNDFRHDHMAIAFGPDGRGYLQSDFFYNFTRYDRTDKREIATLIVTLLDPGFSIERQVILEAETRALTHDGDAYIFGSALSPIATTAHGEVVLATTTNRMQLYDGALAPIGTCTGLSDLVGLPDALIGLVDHERLVIAPATPLRDGIPAVRTITTLLAELAARVEFFEFRGYAGSLAVLDRDRILVPLLTGAGRSGWRDASAFKYVVVDAKGAIVATLPLGAADSPYGKVAQASIAGVAHRPLAAWLTRSDAALHVFSRDGERLTRLGLVDELAALAPLGLFGVAPTGELIFVHRKHHTLVVTNPVRELGELEPALANAAAAYKGEYARLKKAVPWQRGRFLGYEAHTPPASAAPARKQAVARAPITVVAPPTPRDPLEAVSLQPRDLDVMRVYADSLGEAGDPLGEYIAISCALESAIDRAPLVARRNELRAAHGARWLARWNDPVPLFDRRTATFGGLPCDVAIEKLPRDLAALDRQLRALPIHHTSIRKLGARDIAKLSTLATLHRTLELWISGDSKHKLGKSVATWLVEQQLTQLRSLGFSGSELTGDDLRALLATMPELDELSTLNCHVTADALASLTAPRITQLSLAFNPVGSAGFAALREWRGLRRLALASADIGDDVAAIAPFTLPVTDLDLEDNPRLGARGLAWLVAAMPALRELAFSRSLTAAAVASLRPIAGQLETLSATWLEPDVIERLVDDVIARAPRLSKLVLGSATGIAPRVCDLPLEMLELDDVTSADAGSLANHAPTTLRRLDLAGTLSDAALGRLARSPRLAGLRSLSIHAEDATEAGIADLLGGTWTGLELLFVNGATITDPAPLCVDRPMLTLQLWRCKITKPTLAKLAAHWGDRLFT